PEIAPPGSVFQWYFHAEVPGSGQATVIMPREIIFHVDDLLPLIWEMEDVYENGSQSVSVEAISCSNIICDLLTSPTGCQIQTFKLINNHKITVTYTQQLHEHIVTKLPITPGACTLFLSEQITHPIQGFHVMEFPLWKLGTLLDENWIEEDILNDIAELLYFDIATSFFNDAHQLYT
ncbi:hypothetical protein PAXRUDRAFT_134632, partial [Paxillus rubicundulus Ve08.2h10]